MVAVCCDVLRMLDLLLTLSLSLQYATNPR